MQSYFVAVERFISQHGPAIKVSGFVTRDLAHFYGVPHTTVLIIPLRVTESETVEILVHRRPPNKKVSPDTWDTFGGHVEVFVEDGQFLSPGASVGDPKVFHQLIDDTALREANEEIKIEGFSFNEGDIHRFGGYGDFEYGTTTPGSNNVEYSTLYVAILPRDVVSISAQDTIGIGGVEVEVKNLKLRSFTLDDLLLDYGKNPSEFADGLGRILEQFLNVPGTRNSFEQFILDFIRGKLNT